MDMKKLIATDLFGGIDKIRSTMKRRMREALDMQSVDDLIVIEENLGLDVSKLLIQDQVEFDTYSLLTETLSLRPILVKPRFKRGMKKRWIEEMQLNPMYSMNGVVNLETYVRLRAIEELK